MKLLELIFLLVFYNLIPIWTELALPVGVKLAGTAVMTVMFGVLLLRTAKVPVKSVRLPSIKRGTDLIWLSAMSIVPEIAIVIAYLIMSDAWIVPKIFAALLPVFEIAAVFFMGFIKTAVGSSQIKLKDYIFIMIFWWNPAVNLFLLYRFYKKARREYFFELDKAELENARAENEICRTKYPIMMVHGIFFRDWQLMNYWGRVPASLIRNGAEIYYGNQQSASSIADSAGELKEQIMKVIEETGAEKVNIIAHSKGGLDSRYAISCLGMDKYVATLTTINTPHKGCDMVDYLLGKFPDKLTQWIARRYNRIFGILGDKEPDFLAGVKDLSAVRLKDYDTEAPDSPEVSYRSCMSVMRNVFSAGFPLNISYLIIKRLNGRNDGLVWESSAEHGRHRFVKSSKTRGISHGDVIDLFRENIEEYDVRDFYVGLAAELKKEGY